MYSLFVGTEDGVYIQIREVPVYLESTDLKFVVGSTRDVPLVSK